MSRERLWKASFEKLWFVVFEGPSGNACGTWRLSIYQPSSEDLTEDEMPTLLQVHISGSGIVVPVYVFSFYSGSDAARSGVLKGSDFLHLLMSREKL